MELVSSELLVSHCFLLSALSHFSASTLSYSLLGFAPTLYYIDRGRERGGGERVGGGERGGGERERERERDVCNCNFL